MTYSCARKSTKIIRVTLTENQDFIKTGILNLVSDKKSQY